MHIKNSKYYKLIGKRPFLSTPILPSGSEQSFPSLRQNRAYSSHLTQFLNSTFYIIAVRRGDRGRATHLHKTAHAMPTESSMTASREPFDAGSTATEPTHTRTAKDCPTAAKNLIRHV